MMSKANVYLPVDKTPPAEGEKARILSFHRSTQGSHDNSLCSLDRCLRGCDLLLPWPEDPLRQGSRDKELSNWLLDSVRLETPWSVPLISASVSDPTLSHSNSSLSLLYGFAFRRTPL